ncbi:hypothetical protein, partial [Profundibacterium mesophilum]|uniref:hypothetical protein n=1 Tax=Profundibacterium mesophilum TaxID=1258573 RepID=UPI001358036E
DPHSNYLAQVTDEAGQEGFSLPQHLDIIEAGGSKPWLQFDWVWDEDEFLGLAEYIAAPYDPATDTPASKPWAYKRHAAGRTAAPIDSFGTILMEFGNENWNTAPS